MKTERSQKGFALLIVVLLVGLLSVTVATMLDVVSVDQVLIGQQVRRQRASTMAEAGLFEVLSSSSLGPTLTQVDIANPKLQLGDPGTPGAMLNSSVTALLDGDYDATITFIRTKAVSDYSQRLFRAAVYDIDVEARTFVGTQASNRMQVEKIIQEQQAGQADQFRPGSKVR
ncbi:MAG: hypothetical protein ACFB9M_15650 [Myxococcota bacterium]